MSGVRKLQAYKSVNTKIEIRLYEREVRRLFKLPVRVGTITGAEFTNGRLALTFTLANGGQFTII